MVKCDILRSTNDSAQIACPLVSLDNSLAVDVLNYRGIPLTSTATLLAFGCFVTVCYAIKAFLLSVSDVALSIISNALVAMNGVVFTVILNTVLSIGCIPATMSCPHSVRMLSHVSTDSLAMPLWVSFVARLLDSFVTFLTFTVKPLWVIGAICVELAKGLFSVTVRTPFYQNTCLVLERPVKASSRVVLVLFSALLLMDQLFTNFTRSMIVVCRAMWKLTERLNFMTVVTSLRFRCGFRRVLFAFFKPRFIRFLLAVATFVAAVFIVIQPKGFFRLLNAAFFTLFHNNSFCIVANIIVQGEGGVKCR